MARRPSVSSVQIAREAGVAQSTVSRVLNGGSVAPQTRRRVLEVLAKHDFQPNLAARSLVAARTGLVGVVIRDLTNPFYPIMVRAVERVLHEEGLRLLLLSDVATAQESLAMLRRERVDGVVFTSALREDPLAWPVSEHGIPVVLCHRTIEGFPGDQVEADNTTAGRLVADHLLDLGHRRIAMVCGTERASTAEQRGAGFRARLAERAPQVDLVEVQGDYDYATSYAAVRELLAAPQPPSALFCHNDVMAHAALNAAAAEGVDVPGQLSVVGCDDAPASAWERIELTTVRQPLSRIAEVAARLLLERLQDPESPLSHEVLPVELVLRATTAPWSADTAS
ncbi:LacI family DNA-binding transcriptional regulator [Kineococcus radiotolerans]|uniref:Alanine racemase n=1 Tax=Kineococcus radiotolerans (strain ATCC BAA-149 / DSM 14245 / SRS30216) TaxID=266940 RepID=A6WAY4_KINRD|nr:LacI family DNA-binding transcriptional regulator [Kineococcus radiotolerans]ABS03973.1 Alanine racemase [Kineococcus radiotolerans SRS30216 = ATCC BAA-149]